MANLNLVQEIVDLIIDHLVDLIPHRPSSYPVSIRLQELKEIALISKAFTPRSQKHLFSTIEIHQKYDYDAAREAVVDAVDHLWEPEIDDANQKALLNLLQVLEKKPHLAGHLHTIKMCEHFGNLAKRYDSIPTLLNILKRYENPRHINVDGNLYYASRGIHTVKPDTLFIQHFRIRSLIFSVWDEIPVTFITNNKDLQSLTLSCCLWTPNDVDPTSVIARPTIKRLSVTACSGLLGYLIQPAVGRQSLLDFSSLEYLRVVSDEKEDMPIVRRLLPLAGRSLKEFVHTTEMLELPGHSVNFDFSPCTTLRTAILSAVSSSYGDLKTLDELVATLGTIPKSPIQELEIRVYLDIDGASDCQPYANLPWEALDREVHRVLSTRNVTQVMGSLHIEFWREDRHAQQDLDENDKVTKGCLKLTEDIRRRFELTTSHEKIKFKITPRVDLMHFCL